MQRLFGLDLGKSALIIGSLYTIIFLYTTIHTSVHLANPYELDAQTIHHSEWGIQTDTKCFHIFFVVLSAASLVCSILLIVGSLRHNHYLVFAWLFDGAIILIVLCLCLIYAFYVFIISLIYSRYLDPGIAAALFVGSVLLLALKIYLWLGMQQLYKDIREGISRRKSLPSTVPLYTQVDDRYVF